MLRNKFPLVLLDIALLLVLIFLFFQVISILSLKQKEKYIDKVKPESRSYSTNIINTNTKPNTDLSYIVIMVDDEKAEIKIINSNGKLVGHEFVDNPIQNSGEGTLSGNTIKTLNYKQPNGTNFTLKILLSVSSTIDVFFYDKNGEVKKVTLNGEQGTILKKIRFDKKNVNNSYIE